MTATVRASGRRVGNSGSGWGSLNPPRPSLARHIDIGVPLFSLLLAAAGAVMVYSATRGPATDLRPADDTYLKRHLVFAAVGVVGMALVALVGHRWARRLMVPAYLATLGMLVAVLSAGVEVKGARARFDLGSFQMQPSELGKVALIVALAVILGSGEGVGIARLLAAGVVTAAPIVAILAQPDLGTILVYGAIFAGMVLVAGVKGRHLAVLALLLLTGAVVLLQSDRLKTYQLERLLVFIDGEADTAARYNLEQAEVAIGNGGITGKGLFRGTQNVSDLVPEQQTDFIFTVIAEETGFVGSAVVLGLFALLLARVWRIGRLADDRYGLLIAAGTFSMLLFQVFQSVGMSTGIMPITGIPLPLISYGGSSVVATFLALGLVQSVHMRRHEARRRSLFVDGPPGRSRR
jgi:rod shape determining protein RodA